MNKTKAFDIFRIQEEHEKDIKDVVEEGKTKNNLPLPFIESSPFKALSTNRETGEVLISDNMFATVLITGEELDIFDEDVLLAILSTRQDNIKNSEYSYSLSLRTIAKKIGMSWRGRKDKTNYLSTSEQILESLRRLKRSTITMHRKKEKRTLMFEIIDFLNIPMTSSNGKLVSNLQEGMRDQIVVNLSKQFFYFYSEYKTFQIKLEDRNIIKDALGKAIYRYIKYLTSFHKTGLHRESLEKLITKVNWVLPTQKRKEKVYIRWESAIRQLNRAKKGLLKIGILLEFPENLRYESIIEIKKLEK